MKTILDACCGSRMFWSIGKIPTWCSWIAGRSLTLFATGAPWKSSRMLSEIAERCLSATERFDLSCSTLRTCSTPEKIAGWP